MVRVPGTVRPLFACLAMSNMKIISIMDAENRAQSDAIAQDLRTALEVVEDEINAVRDRLQQQIDELKQRVTNLEGNTP